MKLRILILIALYTSFIFPQQKFEVNLNDRADDQFKVTVYPHNLTAENNIFHFAATAPGMYQIIDAGRFVRSFKAYDKNGKQVPTEKINTNDWSLSSPGDIAYIQYGIAETWDTTVDENPIYRMGGTSIENDNVVINGPDVFGYFEGKQSDSVYIKLLYPQDWEIGTALTRDNEGYYRASSFDQVVDSPFLLGNLSVSALKIDNTEIDIYTYSKTGMIKSDDIMNATKDVFNALDKFVDGMPVDRYVLLFHFEDESAGAWEHSYSSFYVYQESPFSGKLEGDIRDVIAHETFHMVTPLNIHSEVIEKFNFVKPVLSQHLWLYEGVTEWSSHMMQLRTGIIKPDDYLRIIRQKLFMDDHSDKSISLVKLSLNSTELQPHFMIVYERGSVIADLLNIKLLELSGGKKGLRELIIELSKDYGPNKSFSEKDFFNEITKRTYPEIKDFINSYIIGTQPLPLKEYFEKIGVNYSALKGVDSSTISIDLGFTVSGDRLMIATAPEGAEAKEGDIILKVNGTEMDLSNYQGIFAGIQTMKVGQSIRLTVKRGSEEKDYDVSLKPMPIKHIFEINPAATPEQVRLREAWMKKL
jgi:predicted metalloprotease with PDZ domain